MAKTSVNLSLDIEVKEKAMKIIQRKLDTSLSGYINEKLKELIEEHSIKSIRRLKK